MELNTTKEDMLERFKLYGEIYCLLADINEDKRSMDGFVLESWELEDMLEDEDIDLEFDFGEATGELYELNFEEEMLIVFYSSYDDGYTKGRSVIQIPTDTIRKLKNLLERYVKALKEGEI